MILNSVADIPDPIDIILQLWYTVWVENKQGEKPMGDTYSFCKVRKDKFMSGKSRFILDHDGFCIEGYNLDYSFIVDDLDREDFLYSLVKPDNLKSLDPELEDFIRKSYKPNEEQAIVITRESVQHAIDVLSGLDERVKSMPCDKSCEADVIYKQYLEPGAWGYIEDRPKEEYDTNERVYVSSCKENVDIYKEVEKVYRHRTYHYGFPWCKSYDIGSSYLIESLTEVAKEMDNPDNKDFVFLFAWI